MGFIRDFARAVYYNPLTVFGYTSVATSTLPFILDDNPSSTVKLASFFLGGSGIASVFLTLGGYETYGYYKRFKEVISKGHVDSLGYAIFPCHRATIKMLINDNKNNREVKSKLENLLLRFSF